MSVINILIVDDNTLNQAGLRAYFRTAKGMNVAGIAKDAEECFAILKREKVDLILMDYNLTDEPLGKQGDEVSEEILKQFPEMKIIMISINTELATIQKASKIGLKGYVSKDISKEDLIEGIKKVFAGGEYVDDTIFKIIWKGLSTSLIKEMRESQTYPPLTKMEKVVVKAIVEKNKATYPEIAEHLGRHVDGIKTHIDNVFIKWNLEGRNKIAKIMGFAINHPSLWY